MKIKSLLIATLLLLLFSFSLKTTSMPDPELYAKAFMETIRLNSKEAYVNRFALTSADFRWLQDRMQSDAHINDEYKAEWTRKAGDTAEAIPDLTRTIESSYDEIRTWVDAEQINLNELEYVRMYYEIEYERQGLLHVLGGTIYVKHKEKYYGISIRDAAYVNGRWVFGRIRDIEEVDQYFERLWNGYGNAMREEASVVDTAAVAYDTAVAVEDYYVEEYTEEDYSGPPMTKKQQKIMKKIDAIDKKKDKLYEELLKD